MTRRLTQWMAMGLAVFLMAAGPVKDVQFSVETVKGTTRLIADWGPERTRPVGFKTSVENRVLLITFEEEIKGNYAALSARAKDVALARLDTDKRTLRLALRKDVKVVATQANGRVAFDLLKPDQAPLAAVGAHKPFDKLDQSAQPLQVSASSTDTFGRIAFHWPDDVKYTTSQNGRAVTLSFSKNGKPNLASIRANPPKFIKDIEAVSKNKRLAVTITLQQDAIWQHWKTGEKVFFNALLKPEEDKQPTQSAEIEDSPPEPVLSEQELAEQERSKSLQYLTEKPDEAITAMVRLHASQMTMSFKWPLDVGMAAFRRGNMIWVVFDTPADLNLAELTTAKRYLTNITTFRGPTYTGFHAKVKSSTLIGVQHAENEWTLSLGAERQVEGKPIDVLRRNIKGMGSALVFPWENLTQTIWVTDPEVQDKIGIVLGKGPVRALLGARNFIDANLLETAHGLAISPRVEDIQLKRKGAELALVRPNGLTLSGGLISTAQSGASKGTFGEAADGGFIEAYTRLQRAAAMEVQGETPPVVARMGLARFLLGNSMAFEAFGVLRILEAEDPTLRTSSDLRLMRGIAKAMMGRTDDARLDLQTVKLESNPTAALWRGYIEARDYSWADSRREIENGDEALSDIPLEWRIKLLNTLARACYELGDLGAARDAINRTWAENPAGNLAAQTRLLEAQVLAAQGNPKAATILETLRNHPHEPVAVRAQLTAVSDALEQEAIEAKDAIDILQSLRYRWRGDDFELEVARTLGELYIKTGDDRHGIEVMRAAWLRQASSPVARKLSKDMMKTFKRLFLEGRADEIDPIQALALYYDFKELTPVGPEGDRMIRKLAQRLVAFDLLEQAAELLDHQVNERLRIGPARARVATDLAGIYLMARLPEKALQAIYSSRHTLLPADLNTERRLIQARAMMDLGRYDHALDIISQDMHDDAKMTRAEISWAMGDWNAAAEHLEAILTDRWEQVDQDLNINEQDLVLRMAIAYALAQDRQGLDVTRERYGPFMEKAKKAIAFQTITSDAPVQGVELREAAKRIADVETFSSFSRRLKEKFETSEPVTDDGPQTASAEQPTAPPAA